MAAPVLTNVTLNLTNNWDGFASGVISYVDLTGTRQSAAVTLPSRTEASAVFPIAGNKQAVAYAAVMSNVDVAYKWSLIVHWGESDAGDVVHNSSHAFNDDAGAAVVARDVVLGVAITAASIVWLVIGSLLLLGLVAWLIYVMYTSGKGRPVVVAAAAGAYAGGAVGPLSTSLLGL